MRISDWSSDVCSSDLGRAGIGIGIGIGHGGCLRARGVHWKRCAAPSPKPGAARHRPIDLSSVMPNRRSEEHTSELQSLMRISYAVFCLKKKKKHTNGDHSTQYAA